MMTHPLLPKLRQLDLSGMALTLDVRAAQATESHLTPTEFLAILLDDELERRNQQRLARRLTESGCDSQKSLASFDFTAAAGVNRTMMHDLATCAFVARHENILLCGPTARPRPGRGCGQEPPGQCPGLRGTQARLPGLLPPRPPPTS